MGAPRVVLDTSVLIAALRSRNGASFRVLSLVDTGQFELQLSVPLVLEYEDVVGRPEPGVPLEPHMFAAVLDYLCSVARHHRVFFLWRPLLRDPGDDLVLEVAVASNSDCIITFNKRDFGGAERFGVEVLTPSEFLRSIGVIQ